MLDGAFELIGLTNAEGVLLDVNHSALRFFGTSLDRVIGRPIWSEPWVESAEQATELQAAVHEAAGGQFVRRITRRHSLRGRLEDLDVSLSPLLDDHGVVTFLVAECRIVTGLAVSPAERHPEVRLTATMRGLVEAGRSQRAADRSEDAPATPDVSHEHRVGHSERAYRAAFQAGLAKAEVDIESGCMLAVNERLAHLFDVPAVLLTGRPLEELFPPEAWSRIKLVCADLLREPRTPRVLRVRWCPRHGRDLPVEVVLSAVEGAGGAKPTTCVVSFQDVSRLVIAEQRQHSAEALAAALVESAVDGIVVTDSDGTIELFNPAAERIFGYSRDEILGRGLDDLLPGAPGATEADAGSRAAVPRWSRFVGTSREVQGRRKDGSMFPFVMSVSETNVGTLRKLTCIVHDLTDLRRAESEAARARERFDLAARGSLDILWEWSAEPRSSFYVSERLWERLGYGQGELPHSLDAFASLVHPDDRDVAFEAMRARLALRAPFVVELRLRAKSGDYCWFRGHGQAVWGPHAQPTRMAGSLSDITEERRAKEQLAEQKVLAELGKMAAVVVHEVRNPIAGVQGALDVLIERREEGDEERDIMLRMRRRLDGLSDMVGDLLVYSRPKPVTLVPTRFHDILESVTSLAATTPQCSGVRIDVSCPDIVVRVDGAALARALFNLVLNSAQALRGRGHIGLTVGVEPPDLVVSVADNGPGMPDEVRSRLFEPFFTTKKGGTGLGLSIARRAVEQHGGSVRVESQLGTGTRVVIRLPGILPTVGNHSSSAN